MKKPIFSTGILGRLNTFPTIQQIKDEIDAAWNDKRGLMLWGDMEDLLVVVLRSDISAAEQLALCREIIDAFSKRGHFSMGPNYKLVGAAYHSELYK